MNFFRHLKLLMWKNYLLQLRHPWVTIFEILLPCVFVAMIGLIRIKVEVINHKNSTVYESFDIMNVPNITFAISSPSYKIIYSPNNGSFNQIINEVLDNLNNIFGHRFQFEGKSRVIFLTIDF